MPWRTARSVPACLGAAPDRGQGRPGRVDGRRSAARRRQEARRRRFAGLSISPDPGRDKRSQTLPRRLPGFWAIDRCAAHKFCVHRNISWGFCRDAAGPTSARTARSHDCDVRAPRPVVPVETSALFAPELEFQNSPLRAGPAPRRLRGRAWHGACQPMPVRRTADNTGGGTVTKDEQTATSGAIPQGSERSRRREAGGSAASEVRERPGG